MPKQFEVYCFDCGWKLVAQYRYVGGRKVGATFYGPIVDDYEEPVEGEALTPITVCPGCEMLLRCRYVHTKSRRLLSRSSTNVPIA